MKNYLIRLQLNSIGGVEPDRATHGDVHADLGELGIVTTIISTSGKLYELPHATFCIASRFTDSQVRDILLATVEKYWQDVSLLVIDWESCAFKLKCVSFKQAGPGLLGALAFLPRIDDKLLR